MPVAQGSSRIRSIAGRLCFREMGSFALGEVPVGTLYSGGGKRIPGEFRIGESYRSFSGMLRTGIQKKNLPGLDPSIAQ